MESSRVRSESWSRLAPLAEAKGVVRDAVAAVQNVEHLLRSPRVGPRALAQVIPGLRGLSEPLLAAVEQILGHFWVSADMPVDYVVAEVAAYVQKICGALWAALDRVNGAAMDAKSRLAFEGVIVQVGAELDRVRQLLDLLVHATERSDTDLYIEELVFVAFSTPPMPSPAKAVTVVVSLEHDAGAFRGNPQVLMPLITAGVALTARGPGDRLFLRAACRDGEPLVITLSHEATDGVEHTFQPPLSIGPTLLCAESAARLSSGAFQAERGRVVITWPRQG
ncbi:MAG TPA: hypothetical protein VJT73_11050 [Polyangiaceae bacterium]|nr:hypothetical protein [Polyangiaceae bacterium]